MSKALRVLIADDSEQDCELVVRELERAGFSVSYERVDTSERMAEALTRHSWDVIIANYPLPNFTELGALALVRATTLETPFFLVSGNISADTKWAAIRFGVTDHINKDNLSRLGPAIKNALRRR
jgi:DNA-binding NtrC family response regulator